MGWASGDHQNCFVQLAKDMKGILTSGKVTLRSLVLGIISKVNSFVCSIYRYTDISDIHCYICCPPLGTS